MRNFLLSLSVLFLSACAFSGAYSSEELTTLNELGTQHCKELGGLDYMEVYGNSLGVKTSLSSISSVTIFCNDGTVVLADYPKKPE